jgi:flagellar protein FliL
MSEAPKPETPPAAASPKPKASKPIILLLVLNLGATGFTTFKVATAKPAEAAPPPTPAPLTKEVVGPVVAMDPFVVNLDEPGQSRYLKITFQFEMIEKKGEEVITKNKQVLRDTILSHLSGLKLADTLGVTAKDKLRTDLMTKIEAILGPNQIRRMFFQEFVVQ